LLDARGPAAELRCAGFVLRRVLPRGGEEETAALRRVVRRIGAFATGFVWSFFAGLAEECLMEDSLAHMREGATPLRRPAAPDLRRAEGQAADGALLALAIPIGAFKTSGGVLTRVLSVRYRTAPWFKR